MTHCAEIARLFLSPKTHCVQIYCVIIDSIDTLCSYHLFVNFESMRTPVCVVLSRSVYLYFFPFSFSSSVLVAVGWLVGYWLLLVGVLVFGCCWLVCWLLVIGCFDGLLVVGYWLLLIAFLVVGYWLLSVCWLAVGYWLLLVDLSIVGSLVTLASKFTITKINTNTL